MERNVLILFPERDILGDVMAWFPQAVRFSEIYDCRLTVVMHPNLIRLFKPVYPDIKFITDNDPVETDGSLVFDLCHYYADSSQEMAEIGSPYMAAHILGIKHVDEPPLISVAAGGRPIEEPYVCIAVQSTAQCKYWNNPTGWEEICSWLKECGYRVICIDRESIFGTPDHWNSIPTGAENQTGDKPLPERARWIKHADFFVGLSSGLSWLAWACKVPVVLISGFSKPQDEFYTPYRVINTDVCHGCHSDFYEAEPGNWFWCPRHAGTERQFECTVQITAADVKDAILKIPGTLISAAPEAASSG